MNERKPVTADIASLKTDYVKLFNERIINGADDGSNNNKYHKN